MINHMLSINLSILLVTILCCQDTDKIKVTGVAIDCKAGAAVISVVDSSLYYLDGIDYWDENTIGRKIRVEGKLLLKNFPPHESGLVVQSIVGDSVRFILEPKWKVVK